MHIVNSLRIFSTEFVKLGYADYYSDLNLSRTNHKLADNASIKDSSVKLWDNEQKSFPRIYYTNIKVFHLKILG